MKYTTIHSHIGRTASKSEFQNCDGDDDDEQPSRQNHPLNNVQVYSVRARPRKNIS